MLCFVQLAEAEAVKEKLADAEKRNQELQAHLQEAEIKLRGQNVRWTEACTSSKGISYYRYLTSLIVAGRGPVIAGG